MSTRFLNKISVKIIYDKTLNLNNNHNIVIFIKDNSDTMSILVVINGTT